MYNFWNLRVIWLYLLFSYNPQLKRLLSLEKMKKGSFVTIHSNCHVLENSNFGILSRVEKSTSYSLQRTNFPIFFKTDTAIFLLSIRSWIYSFHKTRQALYYNVKTINPQPHRHPSMHVYPMGHGSHLDTQT